MGTKMVNPNNLLTNWNWYQHSQSMIWGEISPAVALIDVENENLTVQLTNHD